MSKRRSPPSRVVDGTRFVSGGDGHWYSECGRYAIFHMLRGTPEATWELFTTEPRRKMGEYLHGEIGFGMLIHHPYTVEALRRDKREGKR